MLAWTSKLLNSRWTRDVRWTPLLQSHRQFQRTLAKERSRVDRHGGRFGIIVVKQLCSQPVKRPTVKSAKVLHRRLRDTDEMGHLGPDRFGILLPCTDQNGTELVLADIRPLLAAAGLSVSCEAFCYPDRDWPKPTKPDQGAGHHALEREPSFGGQQSEVSNLPLAMVAAPYPKWKRSIDVLGASVGLLLSGPIVLLIAAAIRMSSRGPAFFAQQRTGYLGQTFTIYKLRTMVCDAEQRQSDLYERNERDGPAFKMKSDPRVTRLGKILRATGLDELPQFYNVLRGDMALVGPRPLPVFEADQCASWQRQRELLKPGLTCYWQLIKSRQVSFVQWMRLDLKYGRRQSLVVDARMIVRTFASILLGRVGH